MLDVFFSKMGFWIQWTPNPPDFNHWRSHTRRFPESWGTPNSNHVSCGFSMKSTNQMETPISRNRHHRISRWEETGRNWAKVGKQLWIPTDRYNTGTIITIITITMFLDITIVSQLLQLYLLRTTIFNPIAIITIMTIVTIVIAIITIPIWKTECVAV